MSWEELVPEGWTSKDGRSLRDMSWAERQKELWSNPSLRRLLPKSWRDSRAARLRAQRQGSWVAAPLARPASTASPDNPLESASSIR